MVTNGEEAGTNVVVRGGGCVEEAERWLQCGGEDYVK